MKMKLLASLLVIIVICDNHVSDAAVTLYQGDEGELITELWLDDVEEFRDDDDIPTDDLGNFIPICYKIAIALRMIEKQDINNFEPVCQMDYDDEYIKVDDEDGDENSFFLTMIQANNCVCKTGDFYEYFTIHARKNASHQYFVLQENDSYTQVRAIFDSSTEVFSEPKLQEPKE